MHITDKNNEIIVNFSHFIHSFMFWHRFCKLLKKQNPYDYKHIAYRR